ncbi:hypothetical protein PENTCL1PPCAC_5546, partial [Pristionchus entomophagus]
LAIAADSQDRSSISRKKDPFEIKKKPIDEFSDIKQEEPIADVFCPSTGTFRAVDHMKSYEGTNGKEDYARDFVGNGMAIKNEVCSVHDTFPVVSLVSPYPVCTVSFGNYSTTSEVENERRSLGILTNSLNNTRSMEDSDGDEGPSVKKLRLEWEKKKARFCFAEKNPA